MSAALTLTAEMVVDLGPQLDGWEPVGWGVGGDGTVLVVGRGQGKPPRDYRVVRWREQQAETMFVAKEAIDVTYAEPTLDGGVLLVGARCQLRTRGPDRNGALYEWGGKERARFTLGDGIQDVGVAGDGTIWVSYFDEGVFGNRGWGGPGQEPMGAPGLLGFSPRGAITFAYDAAAARTDSICDAYAMNVTSDGDVWVYFYTEFPLVRIRGGRYQVWRTRCSGARALAVRHDAVLLFGDYKRGSLARVIALGQQGEAELAVEATVIAEDGTDLGTARARGVGGDLYFFAGSRVLRLRAW